MYGSVGPPASSGLTLDLISAELVNSTQQRGYPVRSVHASDIDSCLIQRYPNS